MRLAALIVLALVFPAAASAHGRAPQWKPVPTGSDQQYRGLDAVDKRTAWVGGSAGEVLRTTDGGRSWADVSPPGSEGLLFRDVEAFSAKRASVLAIGEGDASRIYTTRDGGRHWRLAFVNDDPAAFYDCMDFFAGGRRGLALSDPVGGRFRIAATDDWGRSWHVLSNDRHAGRGRGRVRLRRQRHLPRDERRARRLVRERRRRVPRLPLARRRPLVERRWTRRSRPPRRAASSRSRSGTRGRA